MAKNIDFMGAVFPDVPSVKLPQQGGGLVAFDDTTDATATADKILQGYTAYANGQKLTGTASGGITPSGTIQITQNGQVDVTQYAIADVNVSGGGASNVVVGSFKATEDGVLTVPLAYTGTGYPLSLIVFVKDGYNASGTDFASLVSQDAVAVWGFTKSYPNLTPTYLKGNTNENKGDPFYIRKNSTSSATSYAQSSTRGTVLLSPLAPYAAWNCLLSMASATSMSVYVASSGYAFRPNIEYAYHIVYSS